MFRPFSIAEEPEAQFKRIRMVPEGDYNSGKITTSQICDSTSGPGTEEYHVLVKAGNFYMYLYHLAKF